MQTSGTDSSQWAMYIGAWIPALATFGPPSVRSLRPLRLGPRSRWMPPRPRAGWTMTMCVQAASSGHDRPSSTPRMSMPGGPHGVWLMMGPMCRNTMVWTARRFRPIVQRDGPHNGWRFFSTDLIQRVSDVVTQKLNGRVNMRYPLSHPALVVSCISSLMSDRRYMAPSLAQARAGHGRLQAGRCPVWGCPRPCHS